jgi:hypothetical protein
MIVVVGTAFEVDVPNSIYIDTFTPQGLQTGAATPIQGEVGSLSAYLMEFAGDSDGNLIISANLRGSVTVGATEFAPDPTFGTTLLAKVGTDGTAVWVQMLAGTETFDSPLSVATNSANDILLLLASLSGGTLKKLSTDGVEFWSQEGDPNVGFKVATIDASGNVYAGGNFAQGVDFDGKPVVGRPPYLAKYGNDEEGTLQWVKTATTMCPPTSPECAARRGETAPNWLTAVSIGFDANEDVILSSWGNPAFGGGIDFGFGIFPTYATHDLFFSAYSPDAGELRWAKQAPAILQSSVHSVTIDGRGHVIVNGGYSGSLLMDGRLLVTPAPQDVLTIKGFLGSFALPPTDDGIPPDVGTAFDPSGAPIFTMPVDVVAQATSSEGANVFFMPPTTIDAGTLDENGELQYYGTSVVCWPPPNQRFPLGNTEVTCTASDPGGAHESATFEVTVTDTYGPVILNAPEPVVMEATSPAGVAVEYPMPSAIDQVDGARSVSCSPGAGDTFFFGMTEVTCTSSDSRGNESNASFEIAVPYDWSGFLQPINSDGSSVFKLGRSIPIKFKLTGFASGITDAVAILSLRKVSSAVLGDSIEATSTSASTGGNRFRYDDGSDQYIFNLATRDLSKGTWELSVDLEDGMTRTVTISLR